MRSVCHYAQAVKMCALMLGLIGGLSFGSSASAGVLDTHTSAFNDGSGPGVGGAWTATTAFDNGVGVSGTIDWTVFGPGIFPFAGYTPTAGELTYAFQMFSTGTSPIHSLTVNDPNGAADNIGTFTDLVGEAPITFALGTQALWNFAGLDAGENSIGLAFSSTNTPAELFGIVVNGGSFAVAIPLPVPGDIPEPASVALMGIGSLVMLRRRG